MTDREERMEEMYREAREEAYHEKMMYEDEEYAVESLGLGNLTTIEELYQASYVLYNYGYEYTACDLLDTISII
jgi:hypothetical protein